MTVVDDLVVKQLGLVEYVPTWHAMRDFTRARSDSTPDELWLLEHPPVYTVGQGGKAGRVEAIRVDRGGDVTYHGPGQVVVYTLVDLARRGLKVKAFVCLLEQAVIDLVGARAERKPGAPGVYVDGAKIAALGIRVVRGRAYHGVALNVDMDLAPFSRIDPCGYPGLRVTQMRELGFAQTPRLVGERLVERVVELLDA